MLSLEARENWKMVKEAVRGQITNHGFQMWIEPLEILETGEDKWALGCPNKLSRKWILKNYKELLELHLGKVTNRPVTLDFQIRENTGEKPPAIIKSRQMPLPNLADQIQTGHFLRKDYTFDEFVVGESNRYAHSAARSLASNRRRHSNCLYMISKTGLGKSHLSQAVGNKILKQSPGQSVFYITAEDFTDEMVQAIRTDNAGRFKQKYRKKCDVLLLEGVHYLSGKQRTQTELSYILDYLMDADKTLIFTSWYAPRDIPKLQDQFRSRLTSGLITEIDPPDFKTRIKILRKKADGCGVPQEVMEYLASELTEDVRQLINGLNSTITKARILDTPMSVRLAHEVMKNIVRKKKAVTLGIIKDLVCKYYRVTPRDLVSKSRKRTIVRPRQVAMYLGRSYTDQSVEAIARSFNRYHATVLYAINEVESHIRSKDEIHKQLEFLCEKLDGGDFELTSDN